MPINKFLQQLDNYTKNYKPNYVIDWNKLSDSEIEEIKQQYIDLNNSDNKSIQVSKNNFKILDNYPIFLLEKPLNPLSKEDSLAIMNIAKSNMVRDNTGKYIGEDTFYNDLIHTITEMENNGYSDVYTAGVYGNYGVESNFNANAKEKGGKGRGPFQYTPNGNSNINQRWEDYNKWLQENNLEHNTINNFRYLIYQQLKENTRVEKLNEFNNSVKQIQSRFPKSITTFGASPEAFWKHFNSEDADPHRNKLRDSINTYLEQNNIKLLNYDSLKNLEDKETWATPWIRGWKSRSGQKFSGKQSRTMWQTDSTSENPISVNIATEHFMDIYERPNEKHSHLDRRQELARKLYPYIQKIRENN